MIIDLTPILCNTGRNETLIPARNVLGQQVIMTVRQLTCKLDLCIAVNKQFVLSRFCNQIHNINRCKLKNSKGNMSNGATERRPKPPGRQRVRFASSDTEL